MISQVNPVFALRQYHEATQASKWGNNTSSH
uniref:Uncharacterized protein n=1 Tax=Podoviridae sp. ctHPE11 TaxID=2825235 RepID=A0A8S5NV44_9CAUD|nr:MAG TPA: hypothetical protein [Podoviridae sp. ctHPE11]